MLPVYHISSIRVRTLDEFDVVWEAATQALGPPSNDYSAERRDLELILDNGGGGEVLIDALWADEYCIYTYDSNYASTPSLYEGPITSEALSGWFALQAL